MNRKVLIICILSIFIYRCNLDNAPEGKKLYNQHCANCHMEDGQGLRSLIPPITNTSYIDKNRAQLPCWIKNGLNGELTIDGKKFNGEMPGVPYLSDAQIANIINYIQQSWHKGLKFYSESEVTKALKECK